MFGNQRKQLVPHFLFSVLYTPRRNGTEHFKGKLRDRVVCTMLVAQTSIPTISFWVYACCILQMHAKIMYISNHIFSYMCTYFGNPLWRYDTINVFINFHQKMSMGVCNIIVIPQIHIYFDAVFVYWFYSFDCIYIMK